MWVPVLSGKVRTIGVPSWRVVDDCALPALSVAVAMNS